MFNMNEYSIAVYGVPLRYFGDPPSSEPVQPDQTDEEWCAENGVLPERMAEVL